MPYLTPKPKAGGNWISSQVLYGIDTSDPDPKNWKAFGQAVEQAEAEKSKQAPKVGEKQT